MELDELRTFVEIVERGSLSATARATRQSLPTVSRHLKTLESDLNAPLALRTTRKLVVTDAGRRLYAHARRALGEIERATRGAARRQERLIVSCPVTVGVHLVVPRVTALLAEHAELVVEVRLEDRVTELLVEEVDVVIRAGLAPPDSAELVARPLCRFRRGVVGAPSYLAAAGRPSSPSALAGHACLVQTAALGVLDRWRLEKQGRGIVVEVSGRLASTAPQVLLEGARAGLGLALLPPWLTDAEVAAGALERVLPGWQGDEVTVFALHHRRLRGSRGVRALTAALAD